MKYVVVAVYTDGRNWNYMQTLEAYLNDGWEILDASSTKIAVIYILRK